MLRIIQKIKDFLLFYPFTLILKPFRNLFSLLFHFIELNIWIEKNKDKFEMNDGYHPMRNYDRRLAQFEFIIEKFKFSDKAIIYLEFGVAKGGSFLWWLNHNSSVESKFYGFDTFEGLPEDWGGFYKKGDMSSEIPTIDDHRGAFIKGLFQDTFLPFLDKEKALISGAIPKVIHLDADLYSATAFVLSQLFPYLKSGDIIMFDEFNVPTHEFKAFLEFTNNFYIDLIPLTAVNNYYQATFMVK